MKTSQVSLHWENPRQSTILLFRDWSKSIGGGGGGPEYLEM